MCGSVPSHLQSGMGTDDGDVQFGITDKGAYLFAGSHRGEDCKGGQKHLVPAGGQPSRARHKILFRDSEREFPFGELLSEFFEAAGFCVGVSDHKILISSGDFEQFLPERHARSQNLCHQTTPPFRISSIA